VDITMPDEMIFLSVDEVRELTGYKNSSSQMRWLSNHGWQFEVSRIGRPIVGRAYARQKLGFVPSANTTPERPALKLNLAAISGKRKTGKQ
jgi:hypothetical protein